MKTLKDDNFQKYSPKFVATGYRMLKIIKLLMQKPCSAFEINEEFKKDIHLGKAVSDDMICLYINSLRKIGCDISRPSKTNSFCYVLNYQPFLFKITKRNSKTIETVLRGLIHSNDWRLLIDVCEFFNEIKKYCSKDSDLSFFRIISDFSKMDFDLIKKINYFCDKEKFIVLDYKSPNSGIKEISIVPKKLSLENSRLYLCGYSSELEEFQYLRVDRIKNVKLVSIKEVETNPKKFIVAKYKLINQDVLNLVLPSGLVDAKIVGNEIFIEEQVENKFLFVQKILSYGEDCIVLEPESLRCEIIQAVKEVLSFYE